MSATAVGASRVETVTVLFTDVVGSTEHRVRVGEEEAERFRVALDRITRAAVFSHGGRVAKHTGDGMMAVFSGASEALAAAVAVQQAMSSDRLPASGDPVAVRIGVSAGDVTVEGDDCFGLAVVEAQRLESAAQPGQILCSALVRALARGRGGVELRPVGALALKGLDAPIEVDEVVWARQAATDGDGLPPTLAAPGGIPFVGRAAEREALRAAWSAVSRGENRLALIGGEPGIGKTRLAAELAGTALATGGLVLAGRCDELVPVSHQPFVEALEWHLSQPGGPALLGDAPGELVRLVPGLSAVVPELATPLRAAPDAERIALFEAVRSWLAAVTEVRPALLVIDDLHWADMGTLLLVRHLAVNQPVPSLLVLATYRDTELARTHPLAAVMADLARRSHVSRLVLDGLVPGDVIEIVAQVSGDGVDASVDAFASAVHEHTGGNPFFVGEMLRHLVESGDLGPTDDGWNGARFDAALPEGVRHVVGRRVGVLPETTQRLLQLASVIGPKFTLELLGAVAGESDDVVLDALEPALAAHLLVEDGIGRFRFAHAIVRSTLQLELSSTRRCRVHGAVATALEQAYATAGPDERAAFVPELAYHWSEADPTGRSPTAVSYAQRAAELAFDRMVPEEAARWYRRARELLDGADPRLDAELLYKLGEAEAVASEAGWQATLLAAARAAEELGDVARMADALCISSRSDFSETHPDGPDHEKIDLLERALAVAGADTPVRARIAAELAVELVYVGESERRLGLVAECRRIADTLADPLERFRLVTRAEVVDSFRAWERRAMEEQVADREHMLRLAGAAGDQWLASLALRDLFYSGLILGRPTRHELLGKMDELVSTYRHPFVSDHVLSMHVVTALVDGDLDAADAVGRELGRQWARHGRTGELTRFLGGLVIQLARERTGIARHAEAIRATRDAEPEQRRPTAIDGMLALALHEDGRVDEAFALLIDKGRNDFADIADDAARPVTLAMWCEVAAKLRDERMAAALHALVLPQHDVHLITGGWYLGSTARYLGLLDAALGRHEAAAQWFAEAEAAHREVASPPWLARTLVDRAELLVADDDPEGAAELARMALQAIGDRPLAATRIRAETVLSAGGATRG